MKYIIYLTKCNKEKINGKCKIYVGMKSVINPDEFDGYLSNNINIKQPASFMYPKTPLQCAVKKYGVESFERITLYEFDRLRDAKRQLKEILTPEFLRQDFVYNSPIDDYNEYLYQFDMNGKLVNSGSVSKITSVFGVHPFKLQGAVATKTAFLNHYWSTESKINVEEYSPNPYSKYIFLYTPAGKLINGFYNYDACSKFLGISIDDIEEAIKTQQLTAGYYLSPTVTNSFYSKPRRNYSRSTFYLYKQTGEFIGAFVGKDIMLPLATFSWKKIKNILTLYDGKKDDLYVTLTTPKTIRIDVYDLSGNLIEQLTSEREVRNKYNMSVAKFKQIVRGNKYYGDHIFIYNTK